MVTTDTQNSGSPVTVATVASAVGTAPTVTTTTTGITAYAAIGGSVTIHCTNFNPTLADNTVIFNDGATAGTITSTQAGQLTVAFATPPTAGNLTAVVTDEGESSGTAVQVATVTPVVTVNSANLAINAGTITINGYGFDPAGTNTVSFDDGAVGTVTAVTPTSLTVTLGTKPTAAGILHATVTTDTVAGSATQVATVAPVVTAGTANSPLGANTIVINGSGFSTTDLSDTVTFSGPAAGGVATGHVTGTATANQLTVTLDTKPTALGNLIATVAVSGGTSTAVQVATVAPVVTAVTTQAPNDLPANATTLTINGSGFDTTPGKNTVAFVNNGAAGIVTGATANTLTVTFSVPPTAGNLTAVVTTDGVSSTAAQVATVTPVVTRSNASLAANATQIVIYGSGFSTTAANDSVVFNDGATAGAIVATATSLTVTLGTKPTTAGSLTATVSVGPTGSQVSGSAVQVATVVPVVTVSTTNLAVNAGTLIINGFGFDPTAANNKISFNHGAVNAITAASATSLTVTFSTNPTTGGSLTATVTTDGVSALRPRWRTLFRS